MDNNNLNEKLPVVSLHLHAKIHGLIFYTLSTEINIKLLSAILNAKVSQHFTKMHFFTAFSGGKESCTGGSVEV